jgi:trigger factor
LKIESEPRDDHQVRLLVEVEPEVMEKFKHQAARKIAEKAKIPGYRPGKAPYAIIKNFYGDAALNEQAVELLVDDQYPKILEEAKIKPAASGQLDEIVSYDPLKLAFVVPLEPEVVLGDYHSIRQEYNLEPVTEEEINRVIHNLQTSYAVAEPAERPAQETDLVYVKMKGVLVHPVEGEDAEVIRESSYQFVIGDSEDTWPMEGFSKELLGLSANEEKKIVHTFPEDHTSEKLKGKEIEFTVNVQSVKSMKLPELNDEFAKSLGGTFSTMEDVRKSIHDEIEQNRTQDYDEKYLSTLIDTIISQSTIKYPPQLVKEEEDHLLEHFQEDLTEQKMDMDTYLKTRQMDKATFLAQEITPVAVKRLLRRLVIDKVSHDEGIKLNIDELKTAVAATMTQLQNEPDYKNYQKRGQVENLVNAVTLDTAGRLLNRDTVERLKTIAKGEFKPEAVEEAAATSEAEQAVTAEESAAEPVAAPVESEPSADSTQTPPAEETPPAKEESGSSESPSAE